MELDKEEIKKVTVMLCDYLKEKKVPLLPAAIAMQALVFAIQDELGIIVRSTEKVKTSSFIAYD